MGVGSERVGSLPPAPEAAAAKEVVAAGSWDGSRAGTNDHLTPATNPDPPPSRSYRPPLDHRGPYLQESLDALIDACPRRIDQEVLAVPIAHPALFRNGESRLRLE
jgi:hypothetical protein